MPYVAPETRAVLDDPTSVPGDPGALNYSLTRLVERRYEELGLDRTISLVLARVQEYMEWQQDIHSRRGYEVFNDVLGALVAAQMEHDRRGWTGSSVFSAARSMFYETIVAPYEERKIAENGDLT